MERSSHADHRDAVSAIKGRLRLDSARRPPPIDDRRAHAENNHARKQRCDIFAKGIERAGKDATTKSGAKAFSMKSWENFQFRLRVAVANAAHVKTAPVAGENVHKKIPTSIYKSLWSSTIRSSNRVG
jgi:hypothetical protein